MAVRACDALPYLRLKQKMEPSTCNAVLKNGEKVEVFMYRGKPAIEINEQFFFADTYPEFAQYELKPTAAPTPEAPVQLVNESEVKDDPVDTSGQRLRLQLARNPDLRNATSFGKFSGISKLKNFSASGKAIL
jgi:hypothetical protein